MARNDVTTNEPAGTSASDAVEEINKAKIYESHERGSSQTPSTVSDTHRGTGLDRDSNNLKAEPIETTAHKTGTRSDNDLNIIEKNPSTSANLHRQQLKFTTRVTGDFEHRTARRRQEYVRPS